MKYSLTDRLSLTCGKLLVDFNIDLTFFIRPRLKNWFRLDLDLVGVKSAFDWACEMGETGTTPDFLRCAENGECETRETAETCDLTVSSWISDILSWSAVILCFIRRRLIDPAAILVLLSSRKALIMLWRNRQKNTCHLAQRLHATAAKYSGYGHLISVTATESLWPAPSRVCSQSNQRRLLWDATCATQQKCDKI